MAERRAASREKGAFCVLAVDCGTTRFKAAVVGAQGEVCAVSASDNVLNKTGEGVYEMEAEWLGSNLAKCVRTALSESGKEADVAVAAVTGQGSAPVCLDGDGDPVCPVISHLDRRASKERELLAAQAGEVGYVATKIFPNLLWLRQNAGQRFARVRHVLDIREYVGFLLSGAYSYDSGSMGGGAIERLSAVAKVDPSLFGEAHDYMHPIGSATPDAERRLGLKGVPVIIAPGDSTCAAIGAGLSDEGTVSDVAGSTEVIATMVRSDSKAEAPGFYRLPHLEPGKSFLFMSPPLGFIYKWFVDTFYPETEESERYRLADAEASGTPPQQHRPYFIPSITTAGYSYSIEANFVGVDMNHTRANLAKSVMEGLAMRVRGAMESVGKAGIEVKKVRLSGGCASSDVWNQIRTDIYGVDTELNQTIETSSLGAAMVASVASGVFKDFAEAEQSMVRVGRTYRPDAVASGDYDSVYRRVSEKMNALGSR